MKTPKFLVVIDVVGSFLFRRWKAKREREYIKIRDENRKKFNDEWEKRYGSKRKGSEWGVDE